MVSRLRFSPKLILKINNIFNLKFLLPTVVESPCNPAYNDLIKNEFGWLNPALAKQTFTPHDARMLNDQLNLLDGVLNHD